MQILNKALMFSVLFTASVASNESVAEIAYDFSGFGTVGYTISDQPYQYLKYIDDEGTFYADSLLAGQLDMRFNSKFSMTVQAQVRPDASADSGWEPYLSWAFLSYRPTNDWLFRLGKLRIPGYLNSENRDVGVTLDYARIPSEFDSLSPTYEYIGFALTKSFLFEQGDLDLDVYYGQVDHDWRIYYRETVPGVTTAGSFYMPTNFEMTGVSSTFQTEENIYLASIHYVISSNKSDVQWYDEPVRCNYASSIEYYCTDGAVKADESRLVFVNLASDISLGENVRMAIELAGRRVQGDLVNGQNGYAGYVSLRKNIGKWTPYLFYSRVKTDSDELRQYHSINNTSIPNNLPGASVINPSQKALADFYQAYDQYSIAFGASYAISPKSKLKAEIMRTHIGSASSLVDASAGSDVSNSDITVFSLIYDFAF